MIFVASLIYVTLFFVIPGELVLIIAAKGLPWLPYEVGLILLNAGVYALVLLCIRWCKKLYADLDWKQAKVMGLNIRDLLEVNGWRWPFFLGLVAIFAGAGLLFVHGQLPLPFWFLYAAVVVGVLGVLKRGRLIDLPSDLPEARKELSGEVSVNEASGKKVDFAWRPWEGVSGKREGFEASFVIGQEDYEHAKAQVRYDPVPLENYVRYVHERFSDSLRQVVAYFREQSGKQGYSAIEEMTNVVCFTRSIRYLDDEITRGVPDWTNFPVETLYDSAGNCEDHAILAASLLHHLGHDVALFFLTLRESRHIALGYATDQGGGPFFHGAPNGHRYYYVETVPTSEDEKVGDISAEFLHELRSWKAVSIA